MARLLRNLKFLGFTGLVCFILLELGLAIAAYGFDLKIETPTYTFENTQGFWFDLNPDFGTCHLPNHSYRQRKGCYDIVYHSNSYGFRDVERERFANQSRVVVLGDSFIEGVGVETSERLTNLLEDNTGKPHLNFGMAGNFGPTQFMLAYQSLASSFEHDAVLIGILPANDFIDDDYELGHQGMANRYRPYLVGEYPNYELVYFQDSLHKSGVPGPKSKPLKQVAKNFTYSYNSWLYFRTLLRQATVARDEVLTYEQLPGYFNYTEAQLNRVKYALAEIKKLAKDRKVMVFTIPTLQDLAAISSQHENTLARELGSFCTEHDIAYLDLLNATLFTRESTTYTQADLDAQFLSCDGHWSAQGNEFAAERILEEFYEK